MLSGVFGFWMWQFLGRLHPLMVHFPVALLVVALVLEAIAFRKKNDVLRPGIQVVLAVGAASAVLAVMFGLLLIANDDYSGDVLNAHLWFGVATAALSVVTLWFHTKIFKHQKINFLKLYRAGLLLTVIGVTVAGHLGASLTHGADFLTEVLPQADDESGPETESPASMALIKAGGDHTFTEKELDLLSLEVRTIFAHNCYKCHSADKIKGELRLDKKEFVMKGGESGPVIDLKDPDNSELVRRISLPRSDEDVMPSKGKSLSKDEIAIIKLWISKGAHWPDNAGEIKLFPMAALAPRTPALPPARPGDNNAVDRFVGAYFDKNKIEWPTLIDDKLYIRRVYLDIVGLLPPPETIDAFVANKNPDKRNQLVKELLGMNDAYAQHWLTFWNDALRNDYTGTGYITGGRFGITDWLYESLRDNKPYDAFVRELISPGKRSEGFIRGIQWRGTINASQRVEMQAAQNVSQVLLGLNLKCASCHDSFVSDWKLKDAYAFASIFSDTTLEINRCDKPTGKMAGTKILFEELGTIDSTVSVEEKLKQLSVFLTSPKNGRLYRTLVNRMWAQLMGRGIIEPVDLMDNKPWSQDLLDWLASDFVENNHDIKTLIYTIVTSRTYQLPSVALDDENKINSESFAFGGPLLRRLSAEQFADAVSTVVYPLYPDSTRQYVPAVPASSFARSSLVKNDNLLTALGRPNRENVTTKRSSQANLLQAMELTNGAMFNTVLARGARQWQVKYATSDQLVHEVYRKALGRNPAEAERKAAVAILGPKPEANGVEDLLWSVLLLPEFQLIQ
ncbi:DUF1549 domain-containing protein [Chryseolinea lacunae]|uniref:DUF1549 domain-containing protein n=1 Tax=Chryseolinea lacunae TaxID=2801331 RepID=A0ABS1L1S4_9BACT|nr:DUF1549 domain-containing protein [Chryseolinea lacunae]MBL0745664.1 DUF1549 domain-containing protein [Chryseolinea lacunae]